MARARDSEGAGQHPIARALVDTVRLTREQRFVDGEPARVDYRTIGYQLIAGLDANDVAGDDLVGSKLDQPSVANCLCLWRHQKCKLVERLFGLELLADADIGVDDRDHAEDRVCP